MRIATSLLLLALATTAFAAKKKREEQHYQPPAPTIVATPLALDIAGFDRDGDMIVTRAEFDAGVAHSFALADENKDGKISLLELGDWSEAALGSRGALPGQFDFDRDGDDSISRDEFVGLFNAHFATLDADKDGALKRSELVTFAPREPGRPGGHRRGGEFRGPPPQQ